MPQQALPLELLSLVVDFLRDDKESLKSMSLASRTFLSLCRAQLFHTIRLNSLKPSFDAKCASWAALLDKSTEVLSFLRTLELGPSITCLHDRDPVLYDRHWDHVQSKGVPSIHTGLVQLLLLSAVNAQSITLRFEYQLWKSFSIFFKQALTNFLCCKSITVLSLEDLVGFPLDILGSCRHLEDLSLVSVTTPEPFDARIALPVNPDPKFKSYLTSLTLFNSEDCVEPLIQALSHPRSNLCLSLLQRLSVNLTGSDGVVAMRKLPPIMQSISTLELRTDGVHGYELCNLDKFPNLRTLLITLSYNRHNRPINILAKFISQCTKESNLEDLKLLFRHDVPALEREKGSQDLERLSINKDWQLLERSLLSRKLFPSLKKMSILFRPKDVTTFLSEHLVISLHLFLVKGIPALYSLTNPTIAMFDDRFESYTNQA